MTSAPPPASWPHLLAALLAGSGLAAWAGVALWPLVPPEVRASGVVLPWDLAVAGLAGNWLLAGVIGLVLAALPARLRPGSGGALLAGLALGVPPFLAAGGMPFAVALAAGAAALALAWRTRLCMPSRLVSVAGTALAALAALLFLALAHLSAEAGPKELTLPARSDSAPPGPDVLLISLDTLRADAVLPPSGPDVRRPALPTFHRLRSEGAWAPYALSSSNQTVPGHVGMLTGLGALEHGVRDNFSEVPGDLPCLAERFRAAGWSTAAVIANQLLAPDMGFGHGFELFDDTTVPRDAAVHRFNEWLERGWWLGKLVPRRWRWEILRRGMFRGPRVRPLAREALVAAGPRARGRVTTDQCLRLMARLEEAPRPYFLFVNYLDPHHPYGAPPPWWGELSAGDEPLPAPYRPAFAEDPVRLAQIRAVASDLEAGSEEARRAAAHYQRLYLESVAYLDSLLGELLAQIEASGRPAVVLVTSDHGEHFGEHALMLHGNSVYEELLRVPFLLWGAGVPATEIAAAVHLADVAPTLLALAGLPHQDLDGRQILADTAERAHSAADDERLAVRWRDWKWIGRLGEGGSLEALGLYRLGSDPSEADNLLGGTDLPAELEAALESARARVGRQRAGTAVPDWKQARLNELGYAGED